MKGSKKFVCSVGQCETKDWEESDKAKIVSRLQHLVLAEHDLEAGSRLRFVEVRGGQDMLPDQSHRQRLLPALVEQRCHRVPEG